MSSLQELNKLVQGRVIKTLRNENDLVTIGFADNSRLLIKTGNGCPEVGAMEEIETVRQENGELQIRCTDGTTLKFLLVSPGSAVTFVNEHNDTAFRG